MIPPETTSSVSLELHHYKVGDIIAIYSLARTDQGWVLFGDGDSIISSIPAQSNIVNAKTNPQWFHVHYSSSKMIVVVHLSKVILIRIEIGKSFLFHISWENFFI